MIKNYIILIDSYLNYINKNININKLFLILVYKYYAYKPTEQEFSQSVPR